MKKKSYNVILRPQAGSQESFVNCPITEILLEGNRGGGKSLAVLMKFLMYVGKGFGSSWNGIIFRNEANPLKDAIKKAKEFIPKIFPGSKYIGSAGNMHYRFPTGEILHFGFGKSEEDADKYLSHEYPFMAFEELTTWADSTFYDKLKACCRSSRKGMPRFIVSNTNPYGIGFQWVKDYFIKPAKPGIVIRDDNSQFTLPRVRIHSSLIENKALLDADPNYLGILKSTRNIARRMAWLYGSWDINAGGYFEEYWDEDVHVMPTFKVPNSWKIDRALDWGTTHPFSVGWWAESDGTPIIFDNGQLLHTIKGSLYRIEEFYGCKKGEPNKGLKMTPEAVAKIIKEMDREISKKHGNTVLPGVADSGIFGSDTGETVASKMQAHGVSWIPCKKGPGSRSNGWEVMGSMFEAAIYGGEIRDEELNRKYGISGQPSPGLYICNNCKDFLRTVPSLQIDSKKIDDIDTTQEDHIADETRYRCTAPKTFTQLGTYLT